MILSVAHRANCVSHQQSPVILWIALIIFRAKLFIFILLTLKTKLIFISKQLEDHVPLASALMEEPAWMGLSQTVNMGLHVCVCEDLTASCARNIFQMTQQILFKLHEPHVVEANSLGLIFGQQQQSIYIELYGVLRCNNPQYERKATSSPLEESSKFDYSISHL